MTGERRRRARSCQEGGPLRYVFGMCELDLDRYELRVAGAVAPVERQVFDVLVVLLRHRDRVVLKEELLDTVWGDRFVSESALSSQVKAARRAIGDDGRNQRRIRTVHGRGYQFIGPVQAVDTASAAREEPVARDEPIRYALSDGLSIAYQV